MTNRILVPLDGTILAKRALPWAELMAEALDADIQLLRIVDAMSELSASSGKLVGGELLERATEDAISSLRVTRGEIQGSRVEILVSQGAVPERINEYAHERGATLIVMASHARGEPERTLVGSVAAAVIAQSAAPVMVISPRLARPAHLSRRVLVPQDGSDLAKKILPVLALFAKKLGWTLVLFRVVEMPPPMLPFQGASIPLGPVPDEPPSEAIEDLEAVARGLSAEGIRVETRVGWGDRAEAICCAAEEADCGFIALSTHGRHGIERLALGSVANGVIRAAKVPVLTLSPKA